MPKKRLSETMEKEWARERFADELMKILQATTKVSPERLIAMERLAVDGSTLAKVMVGDVYLNGRHGAVADRGLACQYLQAAYSEGSVEAGYRLARYYQETERHLQARDIFNDLADRGYSPAVWQIGYGYFKGYWGKRNNNESIRFFKASHALGHLWGGYWCYWQLLKCRKSIVAALSDFFKLVCIRLHITVLMLVYPNSDRLRIW